MWGGGNLQDEWFKFENTANYINYIYIYGDTLQCPIQDV